MHRSRLAWYWYFLPGKWRGEICRWWIDSLFLETHQAIKDWVFRRNRIYRPAYGRNSGLVISYGKLKLCDRQQCCLPSGCWRQLWYGMKQERVEGKTGNAVQTLAYDVWHADIDFQGAHYFLRIGCRYSRVSEVFTKIVNNLAHDIPLNKILMEPAAAHTVIWIKLTPTSVSYDLKTPGFDLHFWNHRIANACCRTT